MKTRLLVQELLNWYAKNARPLPWRAHSDPYPIWISEVMLQQTTAKAVIPYFERFLKHFPDVRTLAQADLSEVFELWAGLGYYSRARNLHRAAQTIVAAGGFPNSAQGLSELPGFGPYTSRAVASFAFKEAVGVLDGNVIRVLTRLYNLPLNWWQTKARRTLQSLADELAQSAQSAQVNQALMELGATICTPKNPHCIQCPWLKSCKARQHQQVLKLPLQRPRRAKEFWLWRPKVIQRKSDEFFLVKNEYAPFLRGQWLPPGEVRLLKTKPRRYDFKHMITHHEIYVEIQNTRSRAKIGQWFKRKELAKIAPFSLVQKVIRHA